MRITGMLLWVVLVLAGCSAESDNSAESGPAPAGENGTVELGKDPLPMDIGDGEYVDYMGQLGFSSDELTLWRVTAERHCEDFSTAAEYAGALAVAGPNVYDADPVMIEGLGIRRYCSDDLAAYSEGAAVFQTVIENLDGHCAIPLPERLQALGTEYLQMTSAVCG